MIPLSIRFEARERVNRWTNIWVPAFAIVLALVIAGFVLLASGNNPISTYHQIIEAAFTQPGAFTQTLVSTTPLLFTGLAAAVAFRMRIWNIGAEGQLYVGSIAAAGTGLYLHNLPAPVVVITMIVSGAVAGALWAAIPGSLRAYFNTNEILTSLFLNYVADYLMYYLIFDSTSFWRDLTSPAARVFPQGKYLPASGNWPPLMIFAVAVPFGLIVAFGLSGLLWGMIRGTRYGFEMRVMGDAPRAAGHAGMNIRRKILSIMLVSGAIAGIGGASQVGDFRHVLDPRGLEQAQFGYAGIVVAALARYNPISAVVAALGIGVLTNAGLALQGPSFPIGLTGTMEGILLFCVLGSEIFARYHVRVRRTSGHVAARRTGGAQEAAPAAVQIALSGRGEQAS